MDFNQKELSTFSFNELKLKKEKKEKKVEDPFQPPRTITKHIRDNIKELRKNLTENSKNVQQNLQLQEELNKIKIMSNNNYSNYNSFSTNTNNNTPSLIHMINNITNNNESEVTDFDGLNNNFHFSHNEINLEEDQLNSSTEVIKDKEKPEKDLQIKFDKFPSPKNKTEIKFFFMNLTCYINSLLSTCTIKNNTKLYEELLVFKYKLETRYNDYRNRGLNEQYFINILNQNQEELINKLGMGIWGKKDKKDENSSSFNINSIINIHSNYSFLGKKRKKSLSEMRSITDGSSSYEDQDADGEADSP